MSQARQNEINRYHQAYKHPRYQMGAKRQKHSRKVLQDLPNGSLLDVGAGRGEGIRIAVESGHDPVVGVEPVEYLAGGPVIVGVATQLPFNDNDFDTVMCLDVLEHLVEEDIKPALREMKRVAKNYVFLTASENPHYFRGVGDLHISRRPIAEWEDIFDEIFEGAEREFLGTIGVSPGWLIRV